MKLSGIKKRFFAMRKCIICKKILKAEEKDTLFCPDCRLLWDVAKTESCDECFQSAVECTCQSKEMAKEGSLCLRKLVFFEKGRKAYRVLRAMYLLKRKPHKRTEEFFASEIARAVNEELKTIGVDDVENEVLISYIPRTVRSKRKYGIDHSERMAMAISEKTGIPFAELIQRKQTFGRSQKVLSRVKRFKNAKKQFEICHSTGSEMVNKKYVFLYDDVVTTGASMSACISLLRKSGAMGIICLCIAHNQGKKKHQ